MDRVQVLKQESAGNGGDGGDEVEYPTPIEPQEDALEAAGLYLQSATDRDETVHVKRDASQNLVLTDPVTGSKTLAQLASGGGISESTHKTLRHLVHLADAGGPMEGFTSGAYRETTPSADPFPTSVIWWTNSGKTAKIVEKTVAYNANKTPNTITWKAYDTDGSTVLVTLVDTMAYTTVFETSRTRTWS